MRRRGSTIGLLKNDVMDKILTVNDIVFKIMTRNWGKDESGKHERHFVLLDFFIADPQSEVGVTQMDRWIWAYRQGKYGFYHVRLSDAERIAREIVQKYDVVHI